MDVCKPFGNIDKAKILVIGHDPRLQRSDAQTQYAFFLNYLRKPPPIHPSERHKYDFASSVVSYVQHLGGPSVSLEDMFFTNLCNEFLEHPIGGGTVLIPDEAAERGTQAIEGILSGKSFKVMLPMAPQVFYHLMRLGFIVNIDENLQTFLKRAQPSPVASVRKAYVPIGRSPFLTVCGRKYYYRSDSIPVIPVVHVKQWPLNSRMEPHYGSLMRMATTNARACLKNAAP
ncbi:hypothetical protein ES707_19473 [subsurface metagenome]